MNCAKNEKQRSEHFFVFVYLQCIRCKLYGKISFNLLRLLLCRLTQEKYQYLTINSISMIASDIINGDKKQSIYIMSHICNLNFEAIHFINDKPLHLIYM